jgi:hypothetical protein
LAGDVELTLRPSMEFAIIPDIATYSVGDSLIAELLYCLLETSDVL